MTLIGAMRERYAEAMRDTDPRPSRFVDPAAYLAWTKRADAWAAGENPRYASRDGVTCKLEWTGEVLPLHLMRVAGAPVVAWKARYFMHTPIGTHVEAYGLRRELRALAEADAMAFDAGVNA
ncbi:hypothetical protein ACFWHR_07735 [Leucobacter sp. NPDC058333]|uniref:hypothetical protein n=1 Tax=Leucobacter sp. NPDC058333 TaxID=3346450 RepID=UPI003667F323